jgi:hypothetical protein
MKLGLMQERRERRMRENRVKRRKGATVEG